MEDKLKLDDNMRWFQENDSELGFVETSSRTLHINPPVKLKKNRFYIAHATETSLTVYESIMHNDYKNNGELLQ